MMMKTWLALLLLLAAAGLTAEAQAADAPAAAPYKDIAWKELVPPGWDPMKRFREMSLGRLGDSDPRMQEAMADMRSAFDDAPTLDALNGRAVRLPGYVVPLQAGKDGLSEFLLVPYFGACMHTPPPPANQIVHILVSKPVKAIRAMDTVWVSGVLKTDRQQTEMGVSGYRMEAVLVVPYTAAPRQ